MEPIVAKCGYRCDLCLFFEANFAGGPGPDRISEAFARYYDCQLAPEAIRPCKGCHEGAEAPDKDCRVYPCVREKGLQNCGQCPAFGCETLKTRMDVVEECLAKHPNVSEEDYRLFFGPYLSRAPLTEIHRSARD
ncbi:DUF3795 domain-containing protein [Anaerobaca lacustris]|uniref:DUF3795 domain-containing protein n=1 Tax=Anaerobaca lacustris TaxID=3044600 RepID=A0AAW6U0Z9_9BACT|nr:DUF3795 domain-containing protein [Sedimentisphaerales bacterium M17dextr]